MELKIASTRAGTDSACGHRPPSRVALEAGTHSPWMGEQLAGYDHEVLVANARKVRLISKSRKKSDRIDAESLARLARLDPKLLSPIQHRKEDARKHRMLLRSKNVVVAGRTRLVNHLRHQAEVWGERLPVLDQIETRTRRIRGYDREVERMCEEECPETARLRQVPGAGPLTALCFVLTLEDPSQFKNGRHVGACLGLTPRQHESGGSAPALRITKAGDRTLRRSLASCADCILGPFGPDTGEETGGPALRAVEDAGGIPAVDRTRNKRPTLVA